MKSCMVLLSHLPVIPLCMKPKKPVVVQSWILLVFKRPCFNLGVLAPTSPWNPGVMTFLLLKWCLTFLGHHPQPPSTFVCALIWSCFSPFTYLGGRRCQVSLRNVLETYEQLHTETSRDCNCGKPFSLRRYCFGVLLFALDRDAASGYWPIHFIYLILEIRVLLSAM